MMNVNKNNEYIDLREVIAEIFNQKKLFLKVWLVTFILACAWILPIPRKYKAEIMLAPEAESQVSTGMLGSLASSFGFNVGDMGNGDALYPLLYPDLMNSNEFMVGLFDIPVTTEDGSLSTDYFTYLTKHQKITVYKWPIVWVKRFFKEHFTTRTKKKGESGKVDPFYLSDEEDKLVKNMQNIITCSVDKKTDVITISVLDQDPYISATMADSVRVRLQHFITEYRTNKARIDKEYYEKLTAEALSAYEEAVYIYGRYCDTHRGVILQSMLSERDALENDVQMKFNTYNAMCTQLEAAKAKVQERTPAFTILQGASVPVKAAKPKRMLFVLGMLVLSTIGSIFYVLRDELKKAII